MKHDLIDGTRVTAKSLAFLKAAEVIQRKASIKASIQRSSSSTTFSVNSACAAIILKSAEMSSDQPVVIMGPCKFVALKLRVRGAFMFI